MDIIAELAKSLEPEERKDFGIFIQRNQKRKPDKTKELFVLIGEKNILDREILLEKLYPGDKNLVAYHATRKRLIKQLSEYIFYLQKQADTSQEGQIETLFLVAKHLFSHNLEYAGWDFLIQAEELALKCETYLVLNSIYSFQIEKSASEFAPSLELILRKKEETMKLASEEDNANIAHQIVRHRLMEAMSSGREINLQQEVNGTLKKLKLGNTMSLRPRLMFNMVSIVRSAALARKDFYSLEPFLISHYEAAAAHNVFNRYTQRYKIHLLYMIAHALYRNKKFSRASEVLSEMMKAMQEYQKSQYLNFYPRYCLLKAAVLNYSGKNADAIALLRGFLQESVRTDKVNTFNIYLNLSTYYFQQGQYHSSVKVFQELQHSDAWLSGIMGREWVMKKNLVECINQFELGNSDIVETRIKALQRNFKDLFERPVYKRVQVFISLMQKINRNPYVATTKEFKEEVETSFVFIDAEKEDIQAMTFYAWLKGQMKKEKYYDVLMELVK